MYFLEFRCLITESFVLLTDESEKAKREGVDVLHKAVSLGRKWNILDIFGLKRSDMTWLCSKALEIGLETDYAQKLIRKHNLVPEEPPLHLDNWPWAVKIYTLGRFNVVRDRKSSVSYQRLPPANHLNFSPPCSPLAGEG